MRSLLALLCILLGLSSAAAQTGGTLAQQLEHCRAYLASYEARYRALEIDFELAETDRAEINRYLTFIGADSRRIMASSNRFFEHLYALRRRIMEISRRVDVYKRHCAELEEAIASGPGPGGRRGLSPQGGARLANGLNANLTNAERNAADARRRAAAIRQQLAQRGVQVPQVGYVQPPTVWDGYFFVPGTTFTIFGDFGQVWTDTRAFPDFGQTLIRAGSWYGSFGGLFSIPLGSGGQVSNFWLTTGMMFFALNARLTQVRNLNAPGAVQLTGDESVQGGAIVGGVGGRLPGDLSRIEWLLLGGYGRAWDALSGFGPAGKELFSSRATVAAWLARAALYYVATQNVKVGVVVGIIELERQTGTLANLTNFTIGSGTNTFVGASVGYTFGGGR